MIKVTFKIGHIMRAYKIDILSMGRDTILFYVPVQCSGTMRVHQILHFIMGPNFECIFRAIQAKYWLRINFFMQAQDLGYLYGKLHSNQTPSVFPFLVGPDFAAKALLLVTPTELEIYFVGKALVLVNPDASSREPFDSVKPLPTFGHS